jgi:hypothetical protein
MVAMQDFSTCQAYIAGISWGNMWVRAASAQQGLGKAVGKQAFTDMLRAGKQVGMTNLLGRERTPQQVNGMFVADNIPALLGRLLRL